MMLAKSLQSAAGNAAGEANYIEDVFSTYLYTQNTTSQNIPLQTGVGFTASDEWQSNTLLTTSATPVCAFDSAGNYYLASSDNTNTYIAKFTSTGVKTWQVNLLPSSLPFIVGSIKVAASGAVYVSGGRNGSLPAVCKLTSSGAVSWTRELGSGNLGVVSMDLDSSENVHVVYTNSSLQGQYARFNSSGTQDTANSKTFTTATQTFCRGVTVDSFGNVYICGKYYNGTYYYGYVIKFNSSMAVQWSRALFSTTGDPSFDGVSVDSSGNVYVAGQYRSTNDRPLFAKYNSSGTLQWQKNFFQTGVSFRANAIKTDSAGNSFVGGYGPNNRWFIARIDTNGDVVWQKVFLATASMNTCEANAIDIDSQGGLLVSGKSNESTNSSWTRSQVLKIGQSGLSNGVTAYGTLATGSINYGNAAASATSPSFSVSAGSTFSSVTYTSTANTLSTVFQNIPLSTSTGGLLWIKNRSASGGNIFALSNTSYIQSNTTDAAFTQDYVLELASNGALIKNNVTTNNWASWTFRKQPKFFDVVTYTGTGVARTVPHNLGSVPGVMMVKRTDTTGRWFVYHKDIPNTNYLVLNTTAASVAGSNVWNNTSPTSTDFTVGLATEINASGGTYVAYLFAHDAGGFGESGEDNVISCGSFTTDSLGFASVTLGWEPQWVLVKPSSGAGNWQLYDSMRGTPVGASQQVLYPNLSNVETTTSNKINLNATGFGVENSGSTTYIYIAIRRGPMRVPTDGTSVFAPIASSAASGTALTTNFPIDAQFGKYRSGSASWSVVDRLRGVSTTSTEVGLSLATNSTAAEGTASGADSNNWGSTGFSMPTNFGGVSDIFYNFRRAPGFFDEVCYTGTGVARTVNHNLGVAPELMIVKKRNAVEDWGVYTATTGNTGSLRLNTTGSFIVQSVVWNNTSPTSTVFTVGTNSMVNANADTYVAYLFASCPGVSKCGSFTGNGSSQTINCGFTAGARFVLIKAASTTGDWLVADSARGIVSGNDPYLELNTTNAEVTGEDWLDTDSSGFVVNEVSGSNANTNGVTYIYLAIA